MAHPDPRNSADYNGSDPSGGLPSPSPDGSASPPQGLAAPRHTEQDVLRDLQLRIGDLEGRVRSMALAMRELEEAAMQYYDRGRRERIRAQQLSRRHDESQG